MTAQGSGKAWTYAALSASDNDLSDDAANLEAAVTASAALHNLAPVLFVDRDKGDDSVRLYPGAQGVLREKMGELDSENPAAMRELLKFATGVAPAKRRLLVLADHGGGIIRGIMSDDHRPAKADSYDVIDFARILERDPVDILYFDACFMQMIEVAHDLTKSTDVILASESETTSGASPHAEFMKILDESGRAGTDLAARRLVEAGAGMARSDATLSAVRTAAVADLIPAFTAFTQDLIAALKADRELKGKLREAIGGAQAYLHDTDPHFRLYNSYRDLADMLDRIAEVTGGSPIAAQARAIAGRVRKDVVGGHVEARSFKNSSGITIYAPAGDIVEAGYVQCAFARQTHWGDFLVALNSGGKWANPVQPDQYPRSFIRPHARP